MLFSPKPVLSAYLTQSFPLSVRNLNEPCNYGEFFDNHDMWHFFSSTALFLAFIGLLSIDDDLLYVPRDKIPVF